MPSEFQPVFERLREILKGHAKNFMIGRDTADHYSLDAKIGPATLKMWHGKVKTETIPVAWVQIGKTYVSYHLMGVYGNPKLLDKYPADLRARMQGKSCFNFKTVDEVMFKELEQLTADSLAGLRKAGFIS